MAEICRVLLVTLLLCLYWMPSDTEGGSDITNSPDNDFGPPPALPEAEHANSEISDRRRSADDDLNYVSRLLSIYIESGCKEAGEFAKSGEVTTNYRSFKNYIIQLLKPFFHSGCKDRRTSKASQDRMSYFTEGENYIIDLLSTYISSGCKAARNAIKPYEAMGYKSGETEIINLLAGYFESDCNGKQSFNDGENYIIRQLTAYISFGCKGAVETVGTGGEIQSDPEKTQIIKLISSYFQSGCKAGFVMTTPKPAAEPAAEPGSQSAAEPGSQSAAEPGSQSGSISAKEPPKEPRERFTENNEKPPLEYSAGDIYIINLLTNYTSSGCEGARKIIGTGGAMEYSPGENFAIKLMSSFVKKDCKPMTGKAVDDGSSADAGRHVQSVVLELFLLIFGVCVTRIET